MLPVCLQSEVAHLALDTLPSKDLVGKLATAESYWYSHRWYFPNTTPGQNLSSSSVNWEVELNDGSKSTDAKHALLLDWLRRVIWGIFFAPGDGAEALKAGSAGQVSSGLQRIVRWMVDNSITLPHQLTQQVLDTLLEELPILLSTGLGEEQEAVADIAEAADADEPDEESVSMQTAYSTIIVVLYIWRQRRRLQEAGIAPMASEPWDGKAAYALARGISNQVRGWIKPLPDEVGVPLLNRAMWMLGTPADDVLRLQRELAAAYATDFSERSALSQSARNVKQNLAAHQFNFSVIDGEAAPWHVGLTNYTRADGSDGAVLRVRQLVLAIQAACCLVLQGLTGMRVNELCGLLAGTDSETGLPICVEARTSATGMNTEYILSSNHFKGEYSSREVPWLLGSCRQGGDELPPPVRAILILNELLAPYRTLSNTDKLLVSIASTHGLPKTAAGVARMKAGRVIGIYRDFIEQWVDLSSIPDQSHHATSPNDLIKWRESSGRILTTHPLRKTYALYVLSVHPDLLPAVKRQFHHLSIAITEGAYWGSHIPQIEPIHSVSRQLTSQMIFEVVSGRASLGGKMGKQIVENLDELRSEVEGLAMYASWRAVVRWVEAHDIHVNHSPQGACVPIAASRMECWRRAGARPIGRLEPNYEFREASICAGCECFTVHLRHLSFWRERYINSTVSIRQAKYKGLNVANYRTIRNRAVQAAAFLRSAGESVDQLEPVIEKRLASHVS